MTPQDVQIRAERYWEDATDKQRIQGAWWYLDAYSAIERMRYESGSSLNVREACRMAAILSPRCRWDRNLDALKQVLNGQKVTIPGVLGRQIKLAESVKEGRWALSGPKVTQFYKALIGDRDAVPVDSWMAQAFDAKGAGGAVTAKAHKTIQAGIRRAAIKLDISPRVLQATIWVIVRGKAE
jgi:hypothetical protein